MPIVRYVSHDGSETSVVVPCGASIMDGAVDNGIEGIGGDCGGVAGCATCHVYVDAGWLPITGRAETPHERAMLDLVPDASPCSRLGCQIEVCAALDGLLVRLPERQL